MDYSPTVVAASAVAAAAPASQGGNITANGAVAVPVPQDYIIFTYDDFEGGSGGGEKIGELFSLTAVVNSTWTHPRE